MNKEDIDIMKETTIRAAPRLQFSDDELTNAELKKPIAQVEKAAAKRDRMKARLRKGRSTKKNDAVKAESKVDTVKTTQSTHATQAIKPSPLKAEKPLVKRLRFEDDTVVRSPKGNSKGVISQAVRSGVEQRIAEDEKDNTGLQAVHTAERTGEKLLDAGSQLRQSKIRHEHSRLERAENKLNHANVRFLQKEQELKQADKTGSNPISRANQRRAIKREYMSAGAGRTSGGKTAKGAKKAVNKPSAAKKKTSGFLRSKKGLIVLALGGVLIFTMNAITSCTPIVEVGLHAFVMGTYPAEESDIRAAERAYKQKEDGLKEELAHYERYHRGYDEYIIEADDIWHDPYALISLISAYRGGEEWTINDVQGTLDMLFEWQYIVEETVTTETRYRDEEREGRRLVTDPVTGETYWETYTYKASVPYTYSICTVTVENKILSHAPVYIMSKEKVGLYALYMSTLGNFPNIFAGNPHASTLKDPLEYDVPQELLDADPKFALLVEEANKRLGYPYVWGGYEPETSFDCSGFVSWLFTSTGINNIGHMGATTLYNHSQPVSPAEAKPGDVIFFQGTMGEGTDGITHCGLYVGNNMMVHCGNPCSYADLTDSYWQQHFYGYGRLYEH